MSHQQPQQSIDSDTELPASPDSYGGDYYGHLLEEYKLYVEMTDRISARRIQASQFYISLLSALFGVIAILIEKKILPGSEGSFLLLGSLLGVFLCFVWYVNINSYKQLNSLKFKVIEEMELHLPFPCYAREWQIEKKTKQYQRLSKVEKYVPLSIALLYLGLAIYAGFTIFKQ
ncbi:hypothetical protein BST81_02205 [Leptolyngbya sp. 'hensonii']|uniref:RipA family octameric membrane protein n=1 Tax=Leptolyngbya sp. 'hensonii' TaxID=1922337 RepID=UPI00094FF9FB|nr:hypothetical protein [Leptolyngbya sp. 'hensonii']OLP20072.1 hypothetical protein BST81_02205 [Leptolyngbya sp. 'hensonii']